MVGIAGKMRRSHQTKITHNSSMPAMDGFDGRPCEGSAASCAVESATICDYAGSTGQARLAKSTLAEPLQLVAIPTRPRRLFFLCHELS